MKITKEIKANEEEIESLEMHSVVNIISVISSQFQLIQMETDYPELLDAAIERAKKFADASQTKDRSVFSIESLREFEDLVNRSLSELTEKQAILNDGSQVSEYSSILKRVFEEFEVRLKEIVQRWENPGAWVPFL
ncbi:MAG: hypothetical protein U5K71_14305 [Gracilimonas sp.]|nr:hypothetical protein [Gracilimonas sp.]